MPDFLQLGIKKELNHTLKSLGLVTPTPIQEKTIPAVLDGKDIIAQAQTGTGKTLAFVLPILEKIDVNNPDTQALILTPTRELAHQITKEIKKLMENIDGVSVLAIFGGQDVQHQLKKLKGAQHIIVATPGRLLDHVRRGTIDLSTLNKLVIDEADQMLLMGFLPDVDTIIHETFPSRQTLLFSATIPKEIHALANKYMTSPEHIEIKEKQVTVHKIKQYAVETTDRRKEGTLLHLIQEHQPYLAIIFCRTKARVEKLNATLKEKGFLSDELHGDIPQSKRQRAMRNFRDAKLQYLVATDVAARGLDVEGITHVYNYDVPEDVETYIHRTGRTGRASGDGAAYTLYAPRDVDNLLMIEKGIKQTLERVVIKGISIPDREDYEKEREMNIKKARKTAQKKKEFSSSQNQAFNRKKR